MLFTSCWRKYRNNTNLTVWAPGDSVSIPTSNDADLEELRTRANEMAKTLPFLFTSPASDDYVITVTSSSKHCRIEACLKEAPELSVCLYTEFKPSKFNHFYDQANYKIVSLTMGIEDFEEFVTFINQLRPSLPKLSRHGW